jgi:hypothetical protein
MPYKNTKPSQYEIPVLHHRTSGGTKHKGENNRIYPTLIMDSAEFSGENYSAIVVFPHYKLMMSRKYNRLKYILYHTCMIQGFVGELYRIYDGAIVVSCLAICVNHTTTRQYSSRVDIAYTTDST